MDFHQPKQESNEESEVELPRPSVLFTRDVGQLVSLNIQPQRDFLARDVPNSVNVLCQIQSLPVVKRPSIELVVVLDCSGSMEGSKLQFAKRSIKKCIKHLSKEAGDILHFVKYDTQVQIGFEAGDLSDKKKLCEIVKSAKASGSTNLAGGLLQSQKILKKPKVVPFPSKTDPTKSRPSHIQRVFLFSDGRANVGVTLTYDGLIQITKNLVKQGVSVSSFGLGLDFDEDLMHGIAREGQGDYFFISSAQEIPKFMSQALKGLQSLIGRNASLSIHPSPGTKLTRIYGQQVNPQYSNSYSIGDIVGDNSRNVVFQLETSSPQDKDLKLELCTCVLQYDSIHSITPSRVSNSLSMSCADDFEKMQENIAVLTALLIKRSCEIDREVKRLLDLGSTDRAILIKEAMLSLIQLSKEGLEILKLTPTAAAPRPKIIKRSQVQFDSADWSIQRKAGPPKTTTPTVPASPRLVPASPRMVSTKLALPATTAARKKFDSADWYASADNKFNWKDDKGEDSDSWSSEDEKDH